MRQISVGFLLHHDAPASKLYVGVVIRPAKLDTSHFIIVKNIIIMYFSCIVWLKVLNLAVGSQVDIEKLLVNFIILALKYTWYQILF